MDNTGNIDHDKARAEESAAMERVLTATQRVKTAFASLQSQFPSFFIFFSKRISTKVQQFHY